MMRWLARWWRRRQQALDFDLLWPAFKKTHTLDQARVGFIYHMGTDPAWAEANSWSKEQWDDFISQRLV